MKRFLKCATVALFGVSSYMTASGEEDFTQENPYNCDTCTIIEKREGPSSLKNVVLAFDEETKEFKWKDFSLDQSLSDWKWKTIEEGDVDLALRDIVSANDIELLANHEDVYFQLKKIGSDVAVDLGFKLKGGGPLAAAVCGVVCKIINTAGCASGALIIGGLNPGLGILYGSVCSVLDTAGVAACVSTCLALPTP